LARRIRPLLRGEEMKAYCIERFGSGSDQAMTQDPGRRRF